MTMKSRRAGTIAIIQNRLACCALAAAAVPVVAPATLFIPISPYACS
jgi:hypothetical protein